MAPSCWMKKYHFDITTQTTRHNLAEVYTDMVSPGISIGSSQCSLGKVLAGTQAAMLAAGAPLHVEACCLSQARLARLSTGVLASWLVYECPTATYCNKVNMLWLWLLMTWCLYGIEATSGLILTWSALNIWRILAFSYDFTYSKSQLKNSCALSCVNP